MKKVIWIVTVLMTLGASIGIAQAQDQAQDDEKKQPSTPPWTFGADFAPAPRITGLGESAGSSVMTGQGEKSFKLDQTKDPYVGLHFGYKPNSGFGGEVRYMKFGTAGSVAGSVEQTAGTVILWGANDTPHMESTSPILNGAVKYDIQSSAKVSRMDFLVNYNFALSPGWISLFGGVPILRVEATEDITRAQGFLLYSRLPNGNLGPTGDREDYIYSSSASTTATLKGITGGVEGEICLPYHFVIHGRFAVAVFPWGNSNSDGQFTANKDIYLVNVAGGLTATPTASLRHLNLPGANWEGSDKETVTAIDGVVGLKWRIKLGKASLDLGGGVTMLSLRNLPVAPQYMVHDGFAPGNGMFMPRTRNVKLIAPMVTIGVWF